MFALINQRMPYKYTSVVADDDSICVRIFSPTFSQGAAEQVPLTKVLSSSLVKGKGFCFNETQPTVCTHEIRLSRNSMYWQGGNHLVFYTTPDLYVSGYIAVDRREDIQHLQAMTILAEVLCTSSDQCCSESDFKIYADPNGHLMTNLEMKMMPWDEFSFRVGMKAPIDVMVNQMFQVFLTSTDATGRPVNGKYLVEALSGYVPNRVVNVVGGAGCFVASSFLVTDEVVLKVGDLTLTVGVKNE